MIKIEAPDSVTTCVSLGLHIFHGKQENRLEIHSFLYKQASVEIYLGFQSMEAKPLQD